MIYPRPFLHWAGGKRHLLPTLVQRVREARPFTCYCEPFLGGGALFFELSRLGIVDWYTEVILNDVNEKLIDAYIGVKDYDTGVMGYPRTSITSLAEYESARNRLNGEYPVLSISEQAALFIAINKTCFNGLWRVNKYGKFNVPWGKRPNAKIYDFDNIRACSIALGCARLECGDFCDIPISRNTFYYFDPPYIPASATANFTAYSPDGFSDADQLRLRDYAKACVDAGSQVLISNSDTPRTREIYAGWNIETVSRPGTMNSKGAARGRVGEVLISG